MAQHHITHTCGHNQTHQLYGTNTRGERDREATRRAGLPCTDCARAAARNVHDVTNAAAADQATAAGWPALTGSTAQVAWAHSLRVAADQEIRAYITKGLGPKLPAETCTAAGDLLVTSLIKAHTNAAWWIDRRSGSWRKEAMAVVDRPTLQAIFDGAAATSPTN